MTIWTHGPDAGAWRENIFTEVAGFADLVCTSIAFYVGSGPGESDMQRDHVITSEPEGDGLMTDTTTWYGEEIGVLVDQPERGQDAGLLTNTVRHLANGGLVTGTLMVEETARGAHAARQTRSR